MPKAELNPSSCKIEQVITELEDSSRDLLVDRWRSLYRSDPPKGIGKRLLMGAIAFELQVRQTGRALGATINMGGTALYQGVATLFLAQVFDVQIGFLGMLLVVVMATGAAIGSPGTPGVGIVILATILNSVGIPPAGIAILLGVDRILDMCRTSVNVTGDLAACVTIDRLFDGSVEEELGKVPIPAMSSPEPHEGSNP